MIKVDYKKLVNPSFYLEQRNIIWIVSALSALALFGLLLYYFVFNKAEPAATNNYIVAEVSDKELQRVAEEVSDQATILVVAEDSITVTTNNNGKQKLNFTEQTIFATGHNGMDGKKEDLKVQDAVAISYNKSNNALLYVRIDVIE